MLIVVCALVLVLGAWRKFSLFQTKQELLELRSTAERLSRLRDLLTRVVKGYEERARLHGIAKGNGHGGRKIEIE